MLEEFGKLLLDRGLVLIVFVIVDLLGGMALSWKNGTFKWEKMPEFLQSFSLYVWAWLAAEAISFSPKYFGVEVDGLADTVAQYTGTGTYGLIMVKYGASIIGNVVKTLNLPSRIEGLFDALALTPPKDVEG